MCNVRSIGVASGIKMNITSVDLVRLLCALISTFLVIIELIVFVIQSSKHKKQVQSNSSSTKCSQAKQKLYDRIEKLAISVFICSIGYGTSLILWYFYEFTALCKIIATIYSIFLGFTSATIVLFYLNRFYISFRDTAFEPTSKFIKIFVCVAVMASILIAIGLYLRITNSVDNKEKDSLRSVGSFLLSISWMTDVGLYLLLAYLFSKKLFLLVLMQQQSSITMTSHNNINTLSPIEIISEKSSSVDSLSENQLDLIDGIAKQATLMIIATIAGIIMPLAIVLAAIYSNDDYVFAMYFIVRGIVMVVSPTILWLSFVFASKQYNFCCGRIHKLNYSCCIQCAKKLSTNESK